MELYEWVICWLRKKEGYFDSEVACILNMRWSKLNPYHKYITIKLVSNLKHN